MSTNNVPVANFRIMRFYTKYVPVMRYDEKLGRDVPDLDETGVQKRKAVDMVDIAPIGRSISQITPHSVSSLSKLPPKESADGNPAVKMAWDRWERVEPAYKAWKTGQEMPVSGTPLSAWHGLTQEQAEALRSMGLRSVEELAELSDGVVSKIPFPGARDIIAAAQMFLKAADRNKIVQQVASVEAENKTLKDQLEEMRKIVLEMQAASEAEAPKRGRPRKVEEAAAA